MNEIYSKMWGCQLISSILLSIYVHLVNSIVINCSSDLNSIGGKTKIVIYYKYNVTQSL